MKKTKKTIVAYLILITCCIANAKIIFAQSVIDYYPFHVGDYWLEHTDMFQGEYQPTTSRIEIDSLELISGKEYFRMKQRITIDDGSNEMTWYSWLRVDSSSIIMGAFGEYPEIVQINVPTKTIIIDGNPDDWSGINTLVTDAQGDDSSSYTGDDIKALYIAKDSNNLYLRMDLWDNANTNFGNGPSPNEGIYQIILHNDGPYNKMQLGIGYDYYFSRWSLGYNGSSSNVPQGLEGPDYVGVKGGVIELKIPLTMIGNPSNYNGVEGEVNNCCVQNYGILDKAGLVSATIFDPPLLWMKFGETLYVGDTWEFNAPEMGGNYKWIIESLTETVQVPAGTFNDCIKMKLIIVDTAGDTSQISDYYYAQGVGTVLNKGSGTWSDDFQFELVEYYVQPPQSMQVEPETSPTAGENLTVTVTPSENFQPTTRRLYYRNAGESTWQYVDLQTSGDTLNFEIPANSVTYKGVEYYVYLFDGINEVTYPPVNPQTNPARVQITVDNQVSPLRLSATTYKMVSVPINLENPEICNVLCDDYENYDIKYWRILRWQTLGDSTGYFEYPSIQAAFTPGNSFWLITRSGNAFDVENGTSINITEPAYYAMHPGWNQIASPFPFPVSIDSMSNIDSLKSPVYYNGSEYVYNQTILYPWEGNFVYNPTNDTITITIPPKAYHGGGLKKPQTVFDINEDKEYMLQLSVKMLETKLVDTQNFIGFFQGAESGRDEFDISEAPPIGEFIQCSVLDNGQRFAGNFKPINNVGQQWEVEIRLSEFIKKPIEITLNETGKLLEDFKIFILDKEYFYPIPFENNKFIIELTKENPVKQLKFIIGTEEFAQQNSENISLIPVEYNLKQNYPNPFNSGTIIQYQLGKRTPVELFVFDILGRKVRTLINERQTTGFHSIHWDGLNGSGTQVASGVYFYRLKAGDFIDTRKLLLVR